MPLRRAGTQSQPNKVGPGSAAHHAVKNGVLHCVRGTAQSFRNTIEAIQPVISAMKAVTRP
jgi:hypothetical protein